MQYSFLSILMFCCFVDFTLVIVNDVNNNILKKRSQRRERRRRRDLYVNWLTCGFNLIHLKRWAFLAIVEGELTLVSVSPFAQRIVLIFQRVRLCPHTLGKCKGGVCFQSNSMLWVSEWVLVSFQPLFHVGERSRKSALLFPASELFFWWGKFSNKMLTKNYKQVSTWIVLCDNQITNILFTFICVKMLKVVKIDSNCFSCMVDQLNQIPF